MLLGESSVVKQKGEGDEIDGKSSGVSPWHCLRRYQPMIIRQWFSLSAWSNLESLFQEGSITRAGSKTFTRPRGKSQRKVPAEILELVS
jgi:hypothetical protein